MKILSSIEMKSKRRNYRPLNRGFTLVELLMAMAISLIVMAAVFKIYTTQQDSYLVQEQVAEMQQNARTAKYIMIREIRMAGYDPTGTNDFGFESAGPNIIHFTMDIAGEDGDITYSFTDKCELKRNDQTIAENIEAIGFGYAFDNNDDGNIDTHPDHGYVIWAFDSDGGNTLDKNLDTNDDGVIDLADSENGVDLPVEVAPTGEVALDKIRAVKMWILAKTGREDKNYSDTSIYVVANQKVNSNDGNRRFLVTTTVKCRNMAL